METKADWLRSEIEKVESAMKPEREYDDVPQLEAEWNSGYDYGNNTALTSIITRYKEELKVLENTQ